MFLLKRCCGLSSQRSQFVDTFLAFFGVGLVPSFFPHICKVIHRWSHSKHITFVLYGGIIILLISYSLSTCICDCLTFRMENHSPVIINTQNKKLSRHFLRLFSFSSQVLQIWSHIVCINFAMRDLFCVPTCRQKCGRWMQVRRNRYINLNARWKLLYSFHLSYYYFEKPVINSESPFLLIIWNLREGFIWKGCKKISPWEWTWSLNIVYRTITFLRSFVLVNYFRACLVYPFLNFYKIYYLT